MSADATPDLSEVGPLTLATLAELAAAERVSTAAGQAALLLACRLDRATADTGSSVAAMVREHRATLADAVRDATTVADPVDELRRRRDLKRAG